MFVLLLLLLLLLLLFLSLSLIFFLKGRVFLNEKDKSIEELEKELSFACGSGYYYYYSYYYKVKRLLENPRINPNCQDQAGITPLYVACENGHIEIVKLLLNDKRVDINQTNIKNRNKTPLYIACINQRIKIVKLLLNDERVDVNKEENENGSTPLIHSCFYGRVELVKTRMY